jgi:hypothetical protein
MLWSLKVGRVQIKEKEKRFLTWKLIFFIFFLYQSPFCPLLPINYFKISNVPQHWISGVFFARGISPCQKWWWSLLEREISCSQWEGPSMHSRCLVFFPFMFWGGGGGGRKIFFHFSRLPNVFTLCSFQVPNAFPIFSPTFSPYLLTFIYLGKCCPPFTYIGGPKGRNCTVQNITFCFGEFPLYIFFGVMG